LVFIGGLTAIIGDLASIFGCLIGLKDAVTAITLVALGKSAFSFVVIDREILSTVIRTVPLFWYVHKFQFLANVNSLPRNVRCGG
jgi:hypothetical protein